MHHFTEVLNHTLNYYSGYRIPVLDFGRIMRKLDQLYYFSVHLGFSFLLLMKVSSTEAVKSLHTF
jgi:hypothetical protein